MGSNFRQRRSNATSVSVGRIDYKNLGLLREHLTEIGHIIPRRLTGTNSLCQRAFQKNIKRARYLALIPYTDSHK